MPSAVKSSAQVNAAQPLSRAPLHVKLPPAGPPRTLNGVESAAHQIVREWELHVIVDDEYFSPMYLWDDSRMRAMKYTAHPLERRQQLFRRSPFAERRVAEAVHELRQIARLQRRGLSWR